MSIKMKKLFILLISLFFILGFYSHLVDKKSKIITKITIPESINSQNMELNTTIYYPNLEKTRLSTEEIIIDSNYTNKESILKHITALLIDKLISNKILENHSYQYELYIKNRVLYLDLDKKILLAAKSPKEELFIIYSFVNTLLTPGGVDSIILSVDGKPKKQVNFIKLNKTYRLNTVI